ncbi:unnamed protein product [Calypogeia fissa]
MPRYTTSQTYTEGNTQIVALPESGSKNNNSQIVEFKGEVAPVVKDDEDLEEKLRRISDHVPVRISNTSGSSAGSGSGDFHQYRQMRRREQDRLARMEADYLKRTEEQDFLARREERMRAAEDRTAKKRSKRQKKKDKKRQKKQEKVGALGEGEADQPVQEGPYDSLGPQDQKGQQDGSSDEDDSDNDNKFRGRPPRPNRIAADPTVVPHAFVRKT